MATYVGAVFSLSVLACAVPFLAGLLYTCTCFSQLGRSFNPKSKKYIKLPPFDMLSSLFAGDHYYELRDLATSHPLIELGHDLIDVGFDLII